MVRKAGVFDEFVSPQLLFFIRQFYEMSSPPACARCKSAFANDVSRVAEVLPDRIFNTMSTASDSPDIQAVCSPVGDCLAGFTLSRRRFVAAALFVVLLYLAGVAGQWRPKSDGALYLGIGRSLAEDGTYSFSGQPNNVVTPGLPMVLAASQKLFGEGYWVPHLLMTLSGLAVCVLAYWAVSRLGGRGMGLAVVTCCLFSHSFYGYAHVILTDMPFAVFFWLAVCACVGTGNSRFWAYVLLVLAVVLGITVRAPGGLVMGALGVGLLVDRSGNTGWKKPLARSACVLLAVAATMGVFYFVAKGMVANTPAYARRADSMAALGVLEILLRVARGFVIALPGTMAELLTGQDGTLVRIIVGIPMSACMFVGGILLWRRGQRMPIVTTLLSMAAFAAVGEGKYVHPRYVLPYQPLIMYMMLVGFVASFQAIRARFATPASQKACLTAVCVLLGIVIACNIPKIMRDAYYVTRYGRSDEYHHKIAHGKLVELIELAKIMEGTEKNPSREQIVIVPREYWRRLHYLSRRLVRSLPVAGTETIEEAMQAIPGLVNGNVLDCDMAIVDLRSKHHAEVQSLLAMTLDDSPIWRKTHTGKRFVVYRKISATATP